MAVLAVDDEVRDMIYKKQSELNITTKRRLDMKDVTNYIIRRCIDKIDYKELIIYNGE